MNSSSCFSLNLFRRKKGHSSNNNNGPSSGIPEAICRRFTLDEMKRATQGFHPNKVIGNGGFGTIYKGCVDGDGTTQVAIKRWNPQSSYKGRSEFWKEAELCCQLRHPNLVAYKGFCDEHDEMIRVYEYMPNNSLDHHLFGRDIADEPLSWKKRLKICIDTARGLHYLHSGLKQTIIHRNVTVHNILLDQNCVAKLSDLGLSKVCKGLDRQYSFAKGDLGFSAEPEYRVTGEMTEKTDVYSFGVVLLQVLSGKRWIDTNFGGSDLVEWVYECRRNGSIDQIVDSSVKGQIVAECLPRFVDIAERCVLWDRIERPAMGEVQVGLEDALEVQETADLKGMRV